MNQVPPILSKLKSWSHQEEAYKRAYFLNSYAFFMEMGTGKSKVAVDLIANKQFKFTLIFTVKSAVDSVWPGEFEKYSFSPVSVLHLNIKGTAPEKMVEARRFYTNCVNGGKPCVIVMNYELGIQPAMKKWLMSLQFDAIFCDESQKIQGSNSVVSKMLFHLGKRARFRYLLTGTPTASSPLSIYGQYRFMEPSIFGTNFQLFKSQYCIADDYGRPKEFINLEEMNKKIYSRAYRVRSKDVLDLPPLTTIERSFTLSSKGWKAYIELARILITELDAGRVEIANLLNKGLRLQQITSGWLPVETESGPIFERVDTGKEEALQELLEGVEDREPFIVFCRFKKDLDIVHSLSDKIGRASFELSGRKNELMTWKKEGGPIAVQIQAGGAGIDLTKAHYVCYYSIGYIQPAMYEQSLFRAYRPGQKQPVTIYHLTAKNTIDHEVILKLQHKQEINEKLLTYHLRLITEQNSLTW